ncbi:MAG: hypothetical protein LBQ39_03830 [Tannerellaceae bacterium]|jgi:hypothetical protein|nr:hypothetical protein [Tannerellaceae bacterium]
MKKLSKEEASKLERLYSKAYLCVPSKLLKEVVSGDQESLVYFVLAARQVRFMKRDSGTIEQNGSTKKVRTGLHSHIRTNK